MIQGYLIFHLNLAFSSIPVSARPDVIVKCYWPLLELAEELDIPVGIELTGWTLQQIAELDFAWVERFKQLLDQQKCELIGSGWVQLIGPIVPYEVNYWNQKLGLEAYKEVLGVVPKIALVNEMAFSSGMVDVYVEAGYKGIVMDRDNVRLALGLDNTPISTTPTHAHGSENLIIPVLWSDSIFFQRLQRVVHGDIPISEYMSYVQKRAAKDNVVLPIYSNDAEIFDYRPGRFTTEARLHADGEWVRFKIICKRLKEKLGLVWLSPSHALATSTTNLKQNIKRLSSISQPIPVKKQAKYNINRWTVTGRNDLWLNTSCYRIYQALVNKTIKQEKSWRELCELWASDLRTHITDERWLDSVKRISNLSHQLNLQIIEESNIKTLQSSEQQDRLDSIESVEINKDDEGIYWTIKTPNIHLELNTRRGLAIKSLAFKSHCYKPVVGTLPQGYFSTIELGADFYTGGILIEVPGERSRLTDLEWVTPIIQCKGDELLISAKIPLTNGTLEKIYTIDINSERLKLSYYFHQFKRPIGIVRVGIITLLPDFFSLPLTIQCANGGENTEYFPLDHDVNHGRATSTLVSSTAAFGVTDGCLVIEDAEKRKLIFSWKPEDCAAIPMLKHQRTIGSHLTRLSFSLCELDDTAQGGDSLIPFSFELSTE